MMNSRGLCRVVSLLAIVPVVLSAQIIRERNPVPLKPWAAPLYWQPTQHEAESIVLRPEAATAQLPTAPLVFVGITPCRVVDTRAGQGLSGAFGPPSLNANASRTFPIPSSTTCSIPSTALAYSFNVTVVPPGLLGFITMYPTGQSLPLAATLTDVVNGQIISNSAIVAAGANGSIDVYALNPTELVIDINGYYAAPTSFASSNTASGYNALSSNTSGSNNTAMGSGALLSNATGNYNVAVGMDALTNANGSNNIAIGYQAASNVSAGNSNNIEIGSQGSANDNGTIRIGSAGGISGCTACGAQTSFFAAGIRGVTTSNNDAVPVVIDSNGQLGTVNSSRRFKEDIQDMGDASNGLLLLRPVTFRYQKQFADGSKPVQYGLIAEEVEEVYPDLVSHSADGKIETVKYQVLDSMLLNEVQRQHAEIVSQTDQIRALEHQLKEQQERMARVESALAATFDQERVQ